MGVARVCLDRRSLAPDRRGRTPWPPSLWRRWIEAGVSLAGCGFSRRGLGHGRGLESESAVSGFGNHAPDRSGGAREQDRQ
ncbi:hypothetical protein E2562_037093 [Oryza meyeriana var. granulata]|uniref:Uncharacterized protein n=1 Tax=Oryza meyeriana var. granulata TaxID=110450 RepID=A0A6G1DAQ3_9ORYZ|nr:hypothetical protein E2562_037093 [Oryza meyeriana var. granulata]